MDDLDNGIFRPAWFRDLLAGRLSLGETFWAGNYGVALFHQPLVALLATLPIPRIIPAAVLAVLVVYQLALTRAVIISKAKTPTPIGWKIAGIVVTLGIGGLFASFARGVLSL